jgi:outer membrane protein assembly factor BamB
MIKHFFIAFLTLLLSACFGFFDSDNSPAPTPLTAITTEVHPRLLWSAKVGSGANGEYLKLSPSISGNAIYTASANGVVTAVNKTSGQILWRTNTKVSVTSGPGVGDGTVVVGSRRGDVIALDQATGRIRWQSSLLGEILAKPAVGNQMAVVKAVDGHVHAYAISNGRELWSYIQSEPNLILRGSSAPLLHGNALFIGFANGQLIKFNARNGQVDWMHAIAIPTGAFSIQRMVDIDADPVIFEHRLFAATYQGNIASLDWNSGRTLWTHDISSYTGMSADPSTIYITDAPGNVWAFGVNSGLVNWRQTNLVARQLSAPAAMGQYVVVGDGEGYLHWLSKRDGHFAAREFVGNTILAAPMVENNILYALTSQGSLVAYTLSAS